MSETQKSPAPKPIEWPVPQPNPAPSMAPPEPMPHVADQSIRVDDNPKS